MQVNRHGPWADAAEIGNRRWQVAGKPGAVVVVVTAAAVVAAAATAAAVVVVVVVHSYKANSLPPYSPSRFSSGEMWISAHDALNTYSLDCKACEVQAEPTVAPTVPPPTATPEDVTAATYGGCYSMTTHAVSCALDESHCGDDYWMTPNDLSGYGIECSLDDISLGSCYSSTSHSATCATNSSMCPR